MISTRTKKRTLASIAGGTTYYFLGGLNFDFQFKQLTLNGINEFLDYVTRKITSLEPKDLIKLISSPDNTLIPNTGITIGDFKYAYEAACKNVGCINLLSNLIKLCQGGIVDVTDPETGFEMGQLDTGVIPRNVTEFAIAKFKKQALAITNSAKLLAEPMVKYGFETPKGKAMLNIVDISTKGVNIIGAGLSFYGAEKLHDHFHANENGYFAYFVCGIVATIGAIESQKHLSNALSLFTTGKSALFSGGIALGVHVLSMAVQFGIRELEEALPAIINSGVALANNVAAFFGNHKKEILAGAAVATVGAGVGALAYSYSKK